MGQDWRRYPFHLTGHPQFEFPAAEAEHPDCESDTWFLAGELTAQSGHAYAFLTIVNKNRPGQSMVADFYTFALFDLDRGTYGTYTDYDIAPAGEPKLAAADDRLDLTYRSGAGPVRWRTCRDARDRLVPFTYEVELAGTDQHGTDMRLDLHITPTRAPVPLGGAAHGGIVDCFGQPGTFSYFQTGLAMTGTLTWGAAREQVTGSAGHVDRQWFPLVANGGGVQGDLRARAHEWRTINLDNGVDLSIWRQFDRTQRNALQPFSGATTSSPDADPQFADDVEVTVSSYVRWPESIRTLIPPPAAARYLPDRHRLTSRSLGLDLTGEPLVPSPAHGLPLEYMEGPYRYRGSWQGQAVSGFAFYERSLALYRDWELVDVLAASLDTDVPVLRDLVRRGRRGEALDWLTACEGADPQLVADMAAALQR